MTDIPENTGKIRESGYGKPPTETRFGPGNPGRPKGARSKLGEAFIEAMHEDFQEHGVLAIQKVRSEKPDQYLKVIASILPKELNVNVKDTDGMTDDELLARVRRLDDTIRPFLALAAEGRPDGGDRAETAH